MSKTLTQDTRVAVNLTGRYLLVTGHKNSILGTVRYSWWKFGLSEMPAFDCFSTVTICISVLSATCSTLFGVKSQARLHHSLACRLAILYTACPHLLDNSIDRCNSGPVPCWESQRQATLFPSLQIGYSLCCLFSLSCTAVFILVLWDYYRNCQVSGIDGLCFYGDYFIFGTFEFNSEVSAHNLTKVCAISATCAEHSQQSC